MVKNGLKVQTNEPKKSQYWLNVGYQTKTIDGKDEFITLPCNIALDTMKPLMEEANGFTLMKNKKSNALLKQLIEMAKTQEEGKSVEVNLKVKLYVKKSFTEKGKPEDLDNLHFDL